MAPKAVVEGLELLHVYGERRVGQRDWDFTNGMHWFVDDTWRDQRDPTDDVGESLVNHAGAAPATLAVCDRMKV